MRQNSHKRTTLWIDTSELRASWMSKKSAFGNLYIQYKKLRCCISVFTTPVIQSRRRCCENLGCQVRCHCSPLREHRYGVGLKLGQGFFLEYLDARMIGNDYALRDSNLLTHLIVSLVRCTIGCNPTHSCCERCCAVSCIHPNNEFSYRMDDLIWISWNAKVIMRASFVIVTLIG